MGEQPQRWWRGAGVLAGVVGGLLLALVASTAATGPAAVQARTAAPTAVSPTGAVPPPPLRVIQVNLCDSGVAACYTGRSVAEAAALISVETPDAVTLNEVCRDDVAELERAVAAAVGSASSAFQPARDRSTGAPYRCVNGQDYGIGVVVAWPSRADGGIHPAQDPDDPEERAWLCLTPEAPSNPTVDPTVCTTHLAYTDRELTVAQCRYLFGTVVAAVAGPVVVGADLNLGPGDTAELGSCLPAVADRVDDGRVQHVVATPPLAVVGVRTVGLRGSTDHAALVVDISR